MTEQQIQAKVIQEMEAKGYYCLLYTSDAADE